MKTTKKAVIGLFLFLFIFSISTTQAADTDWGVRAGDVIRWDATHYYDAVWLPSPTTLEWYVIYTVDGFPEFNGMHYINGSVNQNGTMISDPTFLNSISLRSIGSGTTPGNFIGAVLDDVHLGTNLISDSVNLADLKLGFEWIETNVPPYVFTETVPNESFKLTGSGSSSSSAWTYSCVVNYTSDHVLYSVDENYYQIDTEEPGLGDEGFEDFTWRRTSYDHGTGEFPPGYVPPDNDDDADDDDTGPGFNIPGYSMPIILTVFIVGIAILVRKNKKS